MDFKSAISNPIEGYELSNLWLNSDIINLLYNDKVVLGASAALKAIEDFYGYTPSVDGGNITDIRSIRDILFLSTLNKKIIDALTIIAPHTHWKKKQPAIYTYDGEKNAYIIGPHPVLKNIIYTPVSFVFGKDHLIPCEWADNTITINLLEWQECFDLIKTLFHELTNKKIPLGIAINFRFRRSLLDTPQPSLEQPINDIAEENFEDFSYISNESVAVKMDSIEVTEQVSWHTVSDLFYNFSSEEQQIEQELRNLLLSTDNLNEREHLISELSRRLT